MGKKTCPPHYWRISTQRKREGDFRITHEKCNKCHGERDLIENRLTFEAKYTDIVYPEEKDMSKKGVVTIDDILKYKGNLDGLEDNGMSKGGDKLATFRDLEDRREEITEIWNNSSKVVAHVAEQIGIPKSTLNGKLIQWGLKVVKKPTVKKSKHGVYNSPAQPNKNNGYITVEQLMSVIDERFDLKKKYNDFVDFAPWWEGLKDGLSIPAQDAKI